MGKKSKKTSQTVTAEYEGLNIYEALIIAAKNNTSISRKSWGPRPISVVPTNTIFGLILVPFEKCIPSKAEHFHVGVNWQPELNDLIATDWKVNGGNEED